MLELLIGNYAKAEPETAHVNAGKPKKIIVCHMRSRMKMRRFAKWPNKKDNEQDNAVSYLTAVSPQTYPSSEQIAAICNLLIRHSAYCDLEFQ